MKRTLCLMASLFVMIQVALGSFVGLSADGQAAKLAGGWQILRENANITVGDGSVTIVTEKWPNNYRDVPNVVAKTIQNGDFEITAKVTGGLSANYQAVGVVVFLPGNTDQIVTSLRRYHSYLFPQSPSRFGMMQQGGAGPGESYGVDTTPGADAYLKLTKTGGDYRGYYSYNNVDWYPSADDNTRQHSAVTAAETVQIGFFASSGGDNQPKAITISDFTLNGVPVPLTDSSKTVTSVVKPPALRVAQGTAFSQLALPGQVSAVLSDGSTADFGVTWSPTGYNGDVLGTYTVKGAVSASAALNPSGVEAAIDVVVTDDDFDTTVYLSDIQAQSIRVGWGSLQLDQGFDGDPIRLYTGPGQAVTYAKGIVPHANSEVTYDLTDRGARRFQAFAGVNNNRTGSSAFRVYIDEQLVFETPSLRGGDPAGGGSGLRVVDVAIPANARALTLVTDAGGNNNSAHSAWADAKLIVSSAAQKRVKTLDLHVRPTWLENVGDTTKIGVSANLVDGSVLDVQPENCTFVSSDKDVVAVSPDGTVTAMSDGVAAVTVSVTSGDAVCSSVVDIAVGRGNGKLWAIESPGGKTRALFMLGDGGRLSYAVTKNGRYVLDFAPIGLATSLGDFSESLTFVSAAPSVEVDASYKTFSGKKDVYANHYTEAEIVFGQGDVRFTLVVRAYDDGAAFCYRVAGPAGGADVISISDEPTYIRIPPQSQVWYTPHSGGSFEYQSHYTEYTAETMSGLPVFPVLFKTADGVYGLVTEAALSGEYVGSYAKVAGSGLLRLAFDPVHSGPAVASAPWQSPWRAVITGSLEEIVENTLVDNLSPVPDEGADFSWVEPGVSSWSWVNYYGGQERAETHKEYIDLASEMGWKYYILDEGWQPSAGSSVPPINGQRPRYAGYRDWFYEVRDYAAEKGVKLIAWVNSHDLSETQWREERLTQWKADGIAGIKVDFFSSESQRIMKIYDEIYKKTAELGLVVNAHGANKPTGEVRTYPNALAREAIDGQESGGIQAYQFSISPYARGSVGTADVTEQVFSRDESKTTMGFQIALSVMFENGMHTLGSPPSAYLDNPVIYSLYKDFPARWNDIAFVSGEVAAYTTLARRAGQDWYVSTISVEPRDAEIALDFLGEGTYYALIYREMPNSRRSVDLEMREVTSGDVITVPVQRGGGAVVVCRKDRPSIVEGVGVDRAEIRIETKESAAVTASVTPENALIKALTWSSNDESVASVSQTGVVTGHRPGKATITVRPSITDDPNIKAEVAVVVTPPSFVVSGWEILRENTNIIPVSETAVKIRSDAGAVGNRDYPIKNFMLLTVQNGDFEAVVTVSGGLFADYQTAGLAAYLNDGSLVTTVRRSHSIFGGDVFGIMQNGGSGSGEAHVGDPSGEASVYLKLKKAGATFTSYYSFNNVDWTQIREPVTHTGLAAGDTIRIGVFAANGATAYTNADVTFENFTLNGTLLPFAKENTAEFAFAGADGPLTVTVTNGRADGLKGRLIIAAYHPDGTLLRVYSDTFQTDWTETTARLTADVSALPAGVAYKAFCWDEDAAPLFESKSIYR
ncbi:MAG: glycoside hydrolase family 97 catalytic domain-containing protein [Oscillospiraceae bacterium]|nr:glycoside hydrolase family 97 catalytic domain-containing protein [Oscillospiraceae bacterium]